MIQKKLETNLLKSTCFKDNGEIKNYDNIIVLADVVGVAEEVSRIWQKELLLYGKYGSTEHLLRQREVIFVSGSLGGKTSLAYRQYDKAAACGLSKSSMVILDHGKHLADCRRELQSYLCPPGFVYSGSCLLVVTPKTLPVVQRILERKWPHADADYLVLE